MKISKKKKSNLENMPKQEKTIVKDLNQKNPTKKLKRIKVRHRILPGTGGIRERAQ